MANWINGKLVERIQWNSRLCSLRLELALPDFEAGQFLSLGLHLNNKAVIRPYSLVNPPGSGPAEIFFNNTPQGLLSPHLFALKPGDSVIASPRVGGFFTLSQVPPSQYLWLFATGTGLGPYLSILRTPEPWESFERVILVHGIRDHSEQAYREVLEELKQKHTHQFDYFYSVTREAETPHFTRRIPDLLDEGELEDVVGLNLDANTCQVMLCGNSGMVNACIATLTQRGFKKNLRREPGQITVEIY
jgi:ferredoxin--NADP+ reductase